MRKHITFCFLLFFILLVLIGTCVFASEKQELYELRNHMTSKFDEVEGIKWIRDKATPQNLHKNMCYVYLGQKDDYMWPRWFLGFKNESWVFFTRIIFNIDGERREINIGYFDRKSGNNGYGVWEYIDLSGDEHLSLIRKIASSKKTIIRFSGDQYRKDFTVSQKQKGAMKRVVRLYELMK